MSIIDQLRLRQLPEELSWSLLAQHSIGRLAYCGHDWPKVAPTSYRMRSGNIVLPINENSDLKQLSFAPAAFEIDSIGLSNTDGWNVVASGYVMDATHMLNPGELFPDIDVKTAAPDEYLHWLLVHVHHVSGQVFGNPVDLP